MARRAARALARPRTPTRSSPWTVALHLGTTKRSWRSTSCDRVVCDGYGRASFYFPTGGRRFESSSGLLCSGSSVGRAPAPSAIAFRHSFSPDTAAAEPPVVGSVRRLWSCFLLFGTGGRRFESSLQARLE